jgi:prophage regulatory protein
MAEKSIAAPRILRCREVQARTGLSRSTIYDRMNPHAGGFDPDFPIPIPLGSRAVGWFESEINDWLEVQTGKAIAAQAAKHESRQAA